MKAKERHELKKNELEETLENIVAFLKEHGSRMLAVISVIILVMVGFWYVNHSAKMRRAQQWWELLAMRSGTKLPDAAELGRLAASADEPNLSALAWTELGDYLLRKYIIETPSDGKLLTDAINAYERVIASSDGPKLAKASATVGLAVAYENKHQWAEAKKIYKTIIEDDFAGYGAKSVAQYRVNRIEQWRKDSAVKLLTTQPTTTQATQPVENEDKSK